MEKVVTKKRIVYFDILRMAAVFAVVIVHVSSLYVYNRWGYKNGFWNFISVIDSYFRYAVPVFLMVTGSLLLPNRKNETYGEFLKKRFSKVLIPFIVWNIIYFFDSVRIGDYSGTVYNFFNEMLSQGGTRYHLWYLNLIITLYFFIPFFRILADKLDKKNLELLIIILFVGAFFIPTISDLTNIYFHIQVSVLSLPVIFVYIGFMFLGHYITTYGIKERYRKITYVLGVISAIGLAIMTNVLSTGGFNGVMYNRENVLVFFEAVSVFIFITYLFKKIELKEKVGKVLSRLGSLTFGVYLIHVLFMNEIHKLINGSSVFANVPLEVIVVIEIFGTLVVSYLVTYILSKIKYVKKIIGV
ncbi:MAG: acyltransferase family protein [Oscillospiraceae bacterium]|nr:acyltransferase family protein [Oscillospiraceae bacterium]